MVGSELESGETNANLLIILAGFQPQTTMPPTFTCKPIDLPNMARIAAISRGAFAAELVSI